MSIKTIKKNSYLKVSGELHLGLTANGRIMQSPIDQLVQHKSPNKYFDLQMEHVSGPMKGTRIKFSQVQARETKINREVCVCKAYDFPHQKGTGKCQKE